MGCALTKSAPVCPQIDESYFDQSKNPCLEDDATGNPLLASKLKEPDVALYTKEQLELFVHCMSLGSATVASVKNKNLLAVFGNTGSGKSTAINFLYGCQLFSHQRNGSPHRSLDVLPASKGGPYDSVTKIGHSMYSQTLLPRFVKSSDSELIFCDFPGFMDNRGWEINVSNSTTMAQILNNAGTLKFLICINYNTLKANRAKGLIDMLQVLEEIFGSRSKLEEASNSIMLGVTCAPRSSFKHVIAVLKDNFGSDGVVSRLLKNVILICPVLQSNEGAQNLLYNPVGEFSRKSILQRIEILDTVDKSTLTFCPTLSPEDVRSIIDLQEHLEKHVVQVMEASDLSSALELKKVVDGNGSEEVTQSTNPAMELLRKSVCSAIKRHISNTKQTFYGCCMQGPSFNRSGAEKVFQVLKDCEECFQFGEDVASLKIFLEDSIQRNQLYVQTRKNEDELIVTQLKLQTVLEEDIQTEAHLESFKQRTNELIDEIEQLICASEEESIKERHSHTLQLSQKTLKGKIKEFEAYLESRKDNSAGFSFAGAMIGLASNTGQGSAPRSNLRPVENQGSGQNTGRKQSHALKNNEGTAASHGRATLLEGWSLSDDKLLRQRMSNGKSYMSESDSLKLLKACIKHGKLEGSKAKHRKVIVFLGASGAGKSTIVNALSGCELQVTIAHETVVPLGGCICRRPKTAPETIFGPIQVIPQNRGGVKDAVVQIGHGVQSCTLFPQLIQNGDNNEVYCDCPGFFDSRGMEINLGNIISILTACEQATSVKVILLINYCSLIAERGKGATDSLNQCMELFSGRENLLKNSKSVLIVITHAPLGEDPEDTLHCVQSIAAEAKSTSSLALLNALKSRLFVFQPAGPQANKPELLSKVHNLGLLQHCNYQLTLSADDEKTIFTLMSNLNNQCKREIEEQKMADAKESLDHFIQVASLLDHKKVTQVIELLQTAASTYLRPIIEEMNSNYLEDFDNADSLFQTIKELLKLTDSDQFDMQQERHKQQQLERDCQRFYEKTKQTASHVQSLLDSNVDDVELEGLMQLYLKTNGEQWTNSHNWIHIEDKSVWKGIKCNEEGYIVEIDLCNNNLHGTLPDDIFEKFEHLEILDLSNNKLYGELTESLEALKSIQIIRLNDNKDLTGSMPKMTGVEIYFGNTSLGSVGTVSLEFSTFAFWVVSKDAFMKLQEVLPHEEAKKKEGLMYQLVLGNQESNFICWKKRSISSLGLTASDSETAVTRDEIIFISHRWLRGMHPDDVNGSKMQQIKHALQQEQFKDVKFIWMDYFCIPQNKENSDRQQRAINSLPHYVKCCSYFLTLVGEAGESLLEIYEGRGWCRFERFAAFTPMYNCEGAELLMTKMYTHNKDKKELYSFQMTSMEPKELNPLEGNFFDNTDKFKVGPALVPMCKAIIRNHPLSEMKSVAEYTLQSVENSDGTNALEVAAAEGRMDVVRSLLAAGIDPNKTDEHRETFLHRAAREGNVELLRDLLIAGANPDVQNDNGFSPLGLACEFKHVEILQVLMNEGKASFQTSGLDAGSQTMVDVLIKAIEQDRSDLVKTLINIGVKSTQKNGQHRSALMIAAELDKKNCLGTLLGVSYTDIYGNVQAAKAGEAAGHILDLIKAFDLENNQDIGSEMTVELQKMVSQIMAGLDENGNGSIDAKEFIKHFAGGPDNLKLPINHDKIPSSLKSALGMNINKLQEDAQGKMLTGEVAELILNDYRPKLIGLLQLGKEEFTKFAEKEAERLKCDPPEIVAVYDAVIAFIEGFVNGPVLEELLKLLLDFFDTRNEGVKKSGGRKYSTAKILICANGQTSRAPPLARAIFIFL